MKRPGTGRFAAALAALLSMSFPSTGLADGKSDAQKLLTKGNEQTGDGDYLAALESFRAAYAVFPSPKILLNIGTTLRPLGRNVEALDVYETYLKDPAADPARFAEVKRAMAEIEAVIGRLKIQVNLPDSLVRVDNKVIENFTSGMVLRVEPGAHTVVAEHAGLPPAVQTSNVAARQEVVVVLELLPPEVRSRIVVRDVTRVSTAQRSFGLAIGAFGVASVGVASGFGLIAKSRNDEAKGHCKSTTVCDPSGVSLGNDAKADALASTIVFAVGGVALATGVVLFVTAPKKASAPASASIVVAPSPDGGSVLLRGAF